MSNTRQIQSGYSADVRMQLYVNGHTLVIGQLGPDFVILHDPTDHPPADAEIAVSIDGCVSRWPVQLPDGVIAGKPETRIATWDAEANGSTAESSSRGGS